MTVEWGVRYRKGNRCYDSQVRSTEHGAYAIATEVNTWPGYSVEVVRREVGEWKAVEQS